MDVTLSKKAQQLLANLASRQEIAKAITTSTEQRQSSQPKVHSNNKTYVVVFGTPKTLKK